MIPSIMSPYEMYPTIIPASRKPNRATGNPKTDPTPRIAKTIVIIIAKINPSIIVPTL